MLRTSAPIAIFILLAAFLLSRTLLQFPTITTLETLSDLLPVIQALVVPVILLSFALFVAWIIKLVLLPAQTASRDSGASGSLGGTRPVRDRLAREVVTRGILAIVVMAFGLMVLIGIKEPNNLPTTGLSIFTAVLPVFATWVGTVLAAYFTNESFRQAAESTQSLTDPSSAEPITRPGTMVPYERIIRQEVRVEGTASALITVGALKLSDITSLFAPPGVVRVIIFDTNRKPLFVLRHDSMPLSPPNDATLDLYLNDAGKRAAAQNFALTATTATITDGRRLLETRKVTDLFVTEHGREGEPVIGWVPDDNLRSPRSVP